MLPSIGDSSNTNNNSTNKMEGSSGSFLSRMLGRSPSKGAVAPSAQQPAAGQIPSASLAASGPIKGGGGVLGAAATPPQGSLKVAVQGAASSGNSNGWSIGSSSNAKTSPMGLRVPSVKNLEDAAGRAGSPRINTLMATSANSSSSNSAGGLVQRIPSAQRLSPLTATATRPAAPAAATASDASAGAGKLQAASEPDPDINAMSTEELLRVTMQLRKEKAALKQHLEDISGSGKPGSGAGMQQPCNSTTSTTAAAPARTSGVTFGPNTTHRNSTLVVEFAEPRHQQRPSMIAQTVEQHRSGGINLLSSDPRKSSAAKDLASSMEVDEHSMSFIEEGGAQRSSANSPGKPKGSTALETGPSLDPIQATRAAAEAAEVKRQLLMSQSVKKAAADEAEAKKAADAKKQQEAAAAAAATPQAGPAPAPASKRRYKLLSVYPLLPPSMRREEWSLSQFAVEKRLHKGYASEVYKARDIQSGEMMAVKVYNLPALGELNKVQLIREIRLHGSFSHRNIIELYVAFQEDSRVILAQKYADGGDLLKALHHAGGRLTEHSAVSMVIQPLLSCMLYLHSKGIIHRDIKPENILFDEGVLKVADFGLALNTNEENAVTRAGTLHYMAPEVVKNPLKDHPDDFKNENRYHYNVVVDSWAIGCLAYELLAGYPPFTANTQQQVVHNINNMEVTFVKRMTEDAVDFIKGALERNPADRSTTTELIKHPWIQQHMRRGSSRHLTLQPHAATPKTLTDFASGPATAKKLDANRRNANHGVHKESIMAPF